MAPCGIGGIQGGKEKGGSFPTKEVTCNDDNQTDWEEVKLEGPSHDKKLTLDEEEGCPNQDVKLIREDGLNTSFAEEDLLPLSDEEIKLAMDGEENLVRVVGTKEDLKFDKYFKKVLRTRRGWLVEAQSLDGDDIKSLPPKDGRVKIFSIFSH